MVILLVAIDDYFIGGYFIISYWWLFNYKLLLAILSYITIGYCWLSLIILL
jgi:hypothetical protein